MKRKINILKSNNNLINYVDLVETDRAEEPSAAVVNEAQRVFKELKDEYGINYPIIPKQICERVDWDKAGRKSKSGKRKGNGLSTFNANFAGGMIGFYSHCEQVIIRRFTEAVYGGDPLDLSSALNRGFTALIRADRPSCYNTTRQKEINMKQRTEFCLEFFTFPFWKRLIYPLRPAIDAFMKEYNYDLYNFTEVERDVIFDKFTSRFYETVSLLVKEDLSRYNPIEKDAATKKYVALYKEELISIGWKMFSQENNQRTTLNKIISCICSKPKEGDFQEGIS